MHTLSVLEKQGYRCSQHDTFEGSGWAKRIGGLGQSSGASAWAHISMREWGKGEAIAGHGGENIQRMGGPGAQVQAGGACIISGLPGRAHTLVRQGRGGVGGGLRVLAD